MYLINCWFLFSWLCSRLLYHPLKGMYHYIYKNNLLCLHYYQQIIPTKYYILEEKDKLCRNLPKVWNPLALSRHAGHEVTMSDHYSCIKQRIYKFMQRSLTCIKIGLWLKGKWAASGSLCVRCIARSLICNQVHKHTLFKSLKVMKSLALP